MATKTDLRDLVLRKCRKLGNSQSADHYDGLRVTEAIDSIVEGFIEDGLSLDTDTFQTSEMQPLAFIIAAHVGDELGVPEIRLGRLVVLAARKEAFLRGILASKLRHPPVKYTYY